MPNTRFDPKLHGFHFSNNDIEWELHPGSVTGKNLCGGMVYAALDTYLGARKTPAGARAPARRTPINDYIYSRQVHAHLCTVPRLTGGTLLFGALSPESWFVDSLAGEFDRIRKWIDQGCPAPVFLVKAAVFTGHHVLAIGCQSSPSLGNPILTIYDPNAPDHTEEISVNYQDKRFHNSNANPGWELRGFFMDPGYSRSTPPW